MKCLTLIAGIVVTLLGFVIAAEVSQPLAHPELSPGQVWTIALEQADPEATLKILRIELQSTGVDAVFVSLSGPKALAGIPPFSFLIFSREAIERSVVRMIRTDPLSNDLPGYDAWKKSGDDPSPGVSITPSK